MSILIILICSITQEWAELSKWEKLCKKGVDHSLKLERVLLVLEILQIISMIITICHPRNPLPQWHLRHLPHLTGKLHTKVSMIKHFPSLLRDQRDLNGVYPDRPTHQREVTSRLNIWRVWALMGITPGQNLIKTMIKCLPSYMNSRKYIIIFSMSNL